MPNQDPTQNQQDSSAPPATVPEPSQVDPQSSIPVHNDLPPLPDYMTQTNTDGAQENAPADQQSSDSLPGSAAPSDLPPMVATPKKKFGGKRIIATILGVLLLVGGVGAGIILTQQQQLFQQKADEGTGYGAGCIIGIHGTFVCGSTNVPYDPNNPPAGENSGYKSEEDAIWGCGAGGYSQGVNGNYYCGGGDSGDGDGGGGGTSSTSTPQPTITCQNVKAFKENVDTPLTATELSALKAGDIVTFCAFTESSTAKTVTFTINGVVQSPVTPATGCTSAKGTCFCSNSYTIPDSVATFNVSALLSD